MTNNNYGQYFEFWNKLTPEQQQAVNKGTQLRTYHRGENVHGAYKCTGIIYIQTGCLRVYLLNDDGREITLYRLHAGEVCMLSAPCVLHELTFDAFVDAEEYSTCYILDSATFTKLAHDNIAVERFALHTTVGRFSDAIWTMQQILFMKMDKRLAIFLWDEYTRTNNTTLKLTHEQIAKYIGSAREVVSRMLKYFSSEGIVELSRNGIHLLDKDRLKKMAIINE